MWFDVRLWMRAVGQIRDTLAAADPTHAALYRRNAADYLAELAELDRYVRERAAAVPAGRRVLVTAHDAFNYFGRAYGFEVRGLQGISTASEAGAGDVQALARFIAERRIPAIFVESSVSPPHDRGGAGGGARPRLRRRDRRQLFSDAMGDAGTPEGTYVGMVRHNIDTIVEGLRRVTPAVEVADLTVAYREKPVLWDVDLDVPARRADGDRRPERRRQDDAHQGRPGPGAPGRRAACSCTAALTTSSGAWSATCRSAAASTGTSRPTCWTS